MNKKLYSIIAIALIALGFILFFTPHAYAGEYDDLDFDGVVNILNGLAYTSLMIVGGILIIYGLYIGITTMINQGTGAGAGFEDIRKKITWYVVGGLVLVGTPFIIKTTVKLSSELFGTEEPDINIGTNGGPVLAGLERLANIIGQWLSTAGIGLLIIVILWGGIIFLTAGGNAQQVEKARNILIKGIIGGVIIIALGFMINFIFSMGGELFDTASGAIESDIERIASAISSWLAVLGVAILVIVILWSSILYMTAGAREDQTEKARKLLFNGVIGAVIIISIAFVINLIFSIADTF